MENTPTIPAENIGPNEAKYRAILEKKIENGLKQIHITKSPTAATPNREEFFAELIRMEEAPDLPDPGVLGSYSL